MSCQSDDSDSTTSEENNSTSDFSQIDFLKSYTINNENYGTDTSIVIEDDHRVMNTNGLPNHTTGIFPNENNPNTISAQNISYSFPTNPTPSSTSKWDREPGIAVNGVKFEPETAERFVCTTGEVYKIEAFQNLINLGLDSSNAHVQPTGAYHYHGVPTELIELLDKGDDIVLVGFAKDGYLMYYSKSGKYKPSYVLSDNLRTGDMCEYETKNTSIKEDLDDTKPDGTFVSDWQYVEGSGQLDECNGITIDGVYCYFVTDEYPYVSRCLKGTFVEEMPNGMPPRGQHSHSGSHIHH